ncbi:MAG: hypothetical protein QN193_05630 [Armatimonadota bacterium]|nr:hypothetical protein [Armatimonadota bacterium]MDR7443973.1 hypothetical protein [Armatimonadota bacterium]MDR7570071.1 hypothetical protein [Armatimonadota bacterium]MDR7615424.1 hypothetical protein [Armatimonadota bacterium]
MEWVAGLGAFGLLAACCGAKLVALLLLALRGRAVEAAANSAQYPEHSGVTAAEERGRACPWC